MQDVTATPVNRPATLVIRVAIPVGREAQADAVVAGSGLFALMASPGQLTVVVEDRPEFWTAVDGLLAGLAQLGVSAGIGVQIRTGFGTEIQPYLHLIDVMHAQSDLLAGLGIAMDPTALPAEEGPSWAPASALQAVLDPGSYGALALSVSWRESDSVTISMSGGGAFAGGLDSRFAIAAALVDAAARRAASGVPLGSQLLGSHDPRQLADLLRADPVNRQRVVAVLEAPAAAPAAGAVPRWSGIGHLAGEATSMITGEPVDWAGHPVTDRIAGIMGWSAAEVVLRLMDATEVIGELATTNPWHSPAELYRALIAGVLQPPPFLTALALARITGLANAVESIDDDALLERYNERVNAFDALRRNVEDPSAVSFTWAELVAGSRSDLVVSAAICLVPAEAYPDRSLDWMGGTNDFDDQAEDPIGLNADLADVTPVWLRQRIADNRRPVPLLRVADHPAGSPFAAQPMGDLDPYGIEIEFPLAVRQPSQPWSWTRPTDRLLLIGPAVFRLGLTTTPQQQDYHAARHRGYSSAPNTWSFEHDPSIPEGGELVSPIQHGTAADWRAVAAILRVLRGYGAVPDRRASLHVHVSTARFVPPSGVVAESGSAALEGAVSRLTALVDRFWRQLFRLYTNPAMDRHRGLVFAPVYVDPLPEADRPGRCLRPSGPEVCCSRR